MERETGVQSVARTSGTAGNDRQLLPLGFGGSFSKSHSTFEGWRMLLWNRPQNTVSSFSLSATFPAFSLASLTLLLVGYPIDGKADHFVRIRKTELFFDVCPMCLDGFDAEIDLFRDGTSAMSAP
jgi:hypothetical protein